MGDEQKVGIVLRIHHGFGYLLQSDEQTVADAGSHYLGELVPNDKHSVVALVMQFVLHLKYPLLYVIPLQPDVDTGYALCISHAIENLGVACRQQLFQFLKVGSHTT